jgi:peptide/nickel transport system substrate-binding protein/oligopeptide transport system substrate-binding protein
MLKHWILALVIGLFLVGCTEVKDEPPPSNNGGTGTGTNDDDNAAATPEGEKTRGGIYKFPLNTDPPTLDPAMVTDTVSDKVIRSIFDGLVKISPEGAYVPAIADSWEANDDGTIWTFYLKDNVTFQNGQRVTANDFAYSFKRVLNPDTGSSRTWVLDKILGARDYLNRSASDVEGIEVLDDLTLRITLEQPFAPFLGLMAMSSAYVVPQDVVEQYGTAFATSPDATVGTGPFILKEWDHNQHLLLQRNENYFNGSAYVDGLEYRIIAEPLARLQEFRQGNLHHTDIPADLLQDVLNNPSEAEMMVSVPLIDQQHVGFNCQKEPFKDNVALRLAFCHAINRDHLVNTVLNGLVDPATSIVPPGIYGYDAGLPGYEYNIDLAKQYLEEAGYPNGEGLPTITLYHDLSPPRPDVAQVVQNDLARIGVNIELKPMEWGPFLKAVDAGEPALFQLTWLADYPDPENFLFVLLHSSQLGEKGNSARYVNSDFDALVDEAGRISDQDRRWELYAQAEKIAFDDAPWLPLFWNKCTILVSPQVHDLQITSLDRPPVLPAVEIEKVWLSPE